MADVFLSYKREEQARVAELAGALEELKLSVWYDVGLSSGVQWAQEIERQALLAKALVVCWSPGADQSLWVMKEARIGEQRGVLAPALIVGDGPPQEFKHRQASDLRTWAGGELPETVANIRKLLVARARGGEPPLCYEQVLKEIQTTDNALTQEALWGALDAIAAQNRTLREPPLFALVVDSRTRRPGNGYYQKHTFLSGADSELAVPLHEAHLRRVYAHLWPRDEAT